MSRRKIAILVVGMHRSGSSVQSRLLNLVGCDLPKTLMKPIVNNNKAGFWGSQPLSDLNRDILLSIGSDWRPFDSGWYASPTAGSFREQAQALLHQEFGDSRLFVMKDSRLCRLLPFWIEVLETFGAEPRVVLPIRNPLDVVASLKGCESRMAKQGVSRLPGSPDCRLRHRFRPLLPTLDRTCRILSTP